MALFGPWTWNLAAAGAVFAVIALARRGHARGMLIGAAALLVAHSLHRDLVVDDTFIALRYARNLAAGLGPVFNPGDRVEGFTSPLWVAWLAAAARLGLDPLAVARATSLAGALATLVVVGRWSLRLHPGSPLRASVAPLLLALNPTFATWAGAGLETPLFALVVLLAVEAATRGLPARAGAWCAVGMLVRPEAVLLPPLLLGGAWASGRRPLSWRTTATLVLPPAAVALAVAMARHAYYGSWLPNTYHAKVVWGLASALGGAEYVLRFAVLHGGLAVWALPLAAVFLQRRAWGTAGTVAIGLTLATILLGGDCLPAFRFLVPVLPLAYLLLQETAVAFAATSRALSLATVIGLAVLGTQTANAYTTWRHDRQVMRDFVTIGRWLGPRLEADDRVAVSAAGAIGYYTRARVIDRLGLTDTRIARSQPSGTGATGHTKFAAAAVLEQRPTILTVDWNGLYAAPPRALDRRSLAERLELRFDGPELFAAPELERDFEPRCVRLREAGYFVFFVRRDEARTWALEAIR